MCEPISMSTLMMASLAMTTASTVAGVIGQNEQFKSNAANAQQSFAIQQRQTNLGIQQSEASDSLKTQQVQTDMLKAAATAKASANENGVSGNSVDALINDYHASEGRYLSSLTQQQGFDRQQAAMQKEGQKAQAQRQINSVEKPNFIGAALRIGGDALSTYTKFKGPSASR